MRHFINLTFEPIFGCIGTDLQYSKIFKNQKLIICDEAFVFPPSPHLVLDDVNEVYDPAPLLRVREVEHVLLVAAVRGVVSLDLEGKPFF